MRIPGNEWIVGPVDLGDAKPAQRIGLEMLELLSQPQVAGLRPDGQHVGQCTISPRSTPVIPNTKPSSSSSASNAPAAIPPMRWLTLRTVGGTHSEKCSPHVCFWSATHARKSPSDCSGRIVTSPPISVRPPAGRSAIEFDVSRVSMKGF